MTTIATRIAEARKALGLNQSELARSLSVSPQAVQSWESGKARPKGERLEKLATALGQSVDWVLTGRNPTSMSMDASESITGSFIEAFRDKVLQASVSTEEAESKLRLLAEYMTATEKLKNATQSMRDLLVKDMKTGAWFSKIEDPAVMLHIYFITQGAAKGRLLPTELETMKQIGERLQAIEEAEEDKS